MLKNTSSLPIVGLDTAENGPFKVRQVTNRIDAIIGGYALEWAEREAIPELRTHDGPRRTVLEIAVAAPLVRKAPIGANLFTQLGGAFLVLLAVMAAPSFSGQMACVAASVVGYQLRALQAFFGPSN